ncbi:hypothetical protein BD626DRAFT_458976 [Schizophyllum amplum]|uniref:intramembrane prenyl-peptidase Rce1 n=1 Tax=Schizophyllum amplum TaxID=97359 RepID=A0A550CB26_9AGAR|nr:hypothetical protein BD626DRAFT_458976 [Auriculariopsis ampla]
MPPVSVSMSLPTSQAHLLAFVFALSYVGSLYVAKEGRLSFTSGASSNFRSKGRDDPEVIRTRLRAVTFSSIFSALLLLYICSMDVLKWRKLTGLALPLPSFSVFLTLSPVGVASNITRFYLPYLLIPILYTGPLYVIYLRKRMPFQQNSLGLLPSLKSVIGNIIGVRNYVVAPITEEVVFRACIVAVYRLSGATRWKIVWGAPLWFGMAHLHHAWETYNTLGKSPDALKQAVAQTAFQFIYTTLFGAYCVDVFLLSSNILAPLIAHVVANFMGMPMLGYEKRMLPRHQRSITAMYLLGVALFTTGLVSCHSI